MPRWKGYLLVSVAIAVVMFFFIDLNPTKTPGFGVPPVGAAAPPSVSPSPAPAAKTTPTPVPSTNPGYPVTGPATGKGDGGAQTPVAATSATQTWDVRRTPSIDAATIKRVLQGYNSPAVGAADTMYKLGLEYGIDPAFCLAFFINESTAGTAGVARTTKSVGNIRTTAGYQDYQGYRKYASWEEGIEDWYQLIRDLYIAEWELTTVDTIIPVYAPSSDGNNPDHYIATVKKLVTGWRGGR